MTTTPKAPTQAQDRELASAFTGCLATALRQADRLVASVFDERLRDIDLRGTQLTLLGAIAMLERPNQRDLSERTHTDATTLSRNLDRLFDRGLIDRIECTKDRRMRRYTLTNAGRKTLREALPLWQAAQEDIAHRLGGDVCTMMRSLSGVLVDD